eukprot:7396644-Pyramimonas_sp.AAC.1
MKLAQPFRFRAAVNPGSKFRHTDWARDCRRRPPHQRIRIRSIVNRQLLMTSTSHITTGRT